MPVITLVLLALTALIITRNQALIFLDQGRLIVKLDEADPQTAVFYWRSDVKVPMARRFDEAFSEWRGQTDHIIIDLHSPGGALAEGEGVIRVIERMKRTHAVDTRIRNRRACYSMCVPIFLMGEHRIAAANARFMFHEPSAYDQITGERVNEPEFERQLTSRRYFNRYFVNSEMNPVWGENLFATWKGKDVFKTARELVDEGSNIVTELE